MTTKVSQFIAAGCILLGVLLMLPIGYYGKDLAPHWAFIGVPVAWFGYSVLLWHEGVVLSIGGGFLAVCATALFATGIGDLFAGRFVRALLVGVPITTLGFLRKLSIARSTARKQ